MLKNLKQLARMILPSPIIARINHVRAKAKYRNLSSREIFEKIYAEGFWGRDSEGRPISGKGSHTEEIVEPYVQRISTFLQSIGDPIVVDLGCGDFYVGSQIAPWSKKYIACDVSSTILEMVANKYRMSNVEFRNVDLVQDELPSGDVCLIRQVLQHLSNKDVLAFVRKINEQVPYKYIVVTEHLPSGNDFRANVDKATGPGLRLDIGSGVNLASEPFFLKHAGSEEMLSLRQDSGGKEARIVTTLFRL